MKLENARAWLDEHTGDEDATTREAEVVKASADYQQTVAAQASSELGASSCRNVSTLQALRMPMLLRGCTAIEEQQEWAFPFRSTGRGRRRKSSWYCLRQDQHRRP